MPTLAISKLDYVCAAKSIGAKFQNAHKIVWNGRTYQVNIESKTVERQFSGIASRIANATYDFFTRGSLTTRAKKLGDIIFDRERAILPVSIKQAIQGPDSLSSLNKIFRGGEMDMAGVVYKQQYNERDEPVEISPPQPTIRTVEGQSARTTSSVVVRSWLHAVDERPSHMPDYCSARRSHSSVEIRGAHSEYAALYPDPVPENRSKGRLARRYVDDQASLITDRARAALEEPGRQLRPFQQSLPDNKYSLSPSSEIHLPCFGTTQPTEGAQPTRNLFGLSESAAAGAISDVALDDVRYREISKDRNCSGLVMDMLVKGGASNFISPPRAWLFYTPLEVQRYALNLQQHLDKLNAYTDKLVAANNSTKATFGEGHGTNRSVKALMNMLEKNFGSMSKSDLMKPAKQLVEYLESELGQNPAESLITVPDSKRASLQGIINMISKIRDKVAPPPEEQNDERLS